MRHPPAILATLAAIAAPILIAASAQAQVSPSQEQEFPLEWPRVVCGGAGRSVWGMVHDQRGPSLAGAQVYVAGTSCGTLTDSLGRFGLVGLPSGTLRLKADLIGYVTDSTSVAERADTLRYDFVLSSPPTDEEIVVAGGTGSPWSISRETAKTIIGCYSIDVGGPYSLSVGSRDSFQKTQSSGFPGVPTVVQLELFGARSDSVALVGRTLRSGNGEKAMASEWTDPSRWSFAVRGDSLISTWTGTPLVWRIRHRLLMTPDSLVGVSRYVSHEPSGSEEPIRTVWHRRTTCES